MKNILCIIPARSGSKGLPHKNIKIFKGHPLLSWSIMQALQSKYKMKIVVSTDSDIYAQIAIKYGAEVPFLRPKEISNDLSNDYECIKHCVEWLEKNETYIPDIILQLRPTQPCRNIETINNCLDIFIENIDIYDSLRTIIKFDKSPYKMYQIINNKLIPLFNELNGIKEPYNQCRQILPECYLHNGYIDILKIETLKKGNVSGDNIYPYLMNKNEDIDIDTLKDWNKAEL
jgi:CMP-N,N'-diacetyllegionaminic acid synthase